MLQAVPDVVVLPLSGKGIAFGLSGLATAGAGSSACGFSPWASAPGTKPARVSRHKRTTKPVRIGAFMVGLHFNYKAAYAIQHIVPILVSKSNSQGEVGALQNRYKR